MSLRFPGSHHQRFRVTAPTADKASAIAEVVVADILRAKGIAVPRISIVHPAPEDISLEEAILWALIEP
jgi:hypothetical protein